MLVTAWYRRVRRAGAQSFNCGPQKAGVACARVCENRWCGVVQDRPFKNRKRLKISQSGPEATRWNKFEEEGVGLADFWPLFQNKMLPVLKKNPVARLLGYGPRWSTSNEGD